MLLFVMKAHALCTNMLCARTAQMEASGGTHKGGQNGKESAGVGWGKKAAKNVCVGCGGGACVAGVAGGKNVCVCGKVGAKAANKETNQPNQLS